MSAAVNDDHSTRTRLGVITPITAVITAVIAVSALAYQLYADRLKDAEHQIDTWQKTVVNEILSDRSLAFSELYDKYLSKVKGEEYKTRIPPDRYSEQDLRRILLWLREVGAVGYDQHKQYFVKQDSEAYVMSVGLNRLAREDEENKVGEEQRRVESALISRIMNQQPKSVNDLFIQVVREEKSSLSLQQFMEVLTTLWRSGIINIDDQQIVRPEFRSFSTEVAQVSGDAEERVEVLTFWVPTGGTFGTKYENGRNGFEDWLSNNCDWWGKTPAYNSISIGGVKRVMSGFEYELEGPADNSELIGNAKDVVKSKISSLLGIGKDVVWAEINVIARQKSQ